MTNGPSIWLSFPACLLAAWAVFEVAAWFVTRRKGAAHHPSWTLGLWALRPWGAWAVFNLFFRWRRDAGFNNRRTFPFFANLWEEKEAFSDTATRLATTASVWWWWAVIVALGGALAYAAFRWTTHPPRQRSRLIGVLVLLYLAAAALYLAVAALPNGVRTTEERQGSLL